MTSFDDRRSTFRTVVVARIWQSAPGIAFLFMPRSRRRLCRHAAARRTTRPRRSSLSRNLGGSIGISLVQALLARREQFHQVRLVAGLQPLNPVYTHGVRAIARTLTARGAPPVAASKMAVGDGLPDRAAPG